MHFFVSFLRLLSLICLLQFVNSILINKRIAPLDPFKLIIKDSNNILIQIIPYRIKTHPFIIAPHIQGGTLQKKECSAFFPKIVLEELQLVRLSHFQQGVKKRVFVVILDPKTEGHPVLLVRVLLVGGVLLAGEFDEVGLLQGVHGVALEPLFQVLRELDVEVDSHPYPPERQSFCLALDLVSREVEAGSYAHYLILRIDVEGELDLCPGDLEVYLDVLVVRIDRVIRSDFCHLKFRSLDGYAHLTFEYFQIM